MTVALRHIVRPNLCLAGLLATNLALLGALMWAAFLAPPTVLADGPSDRAPSAGPPSATPALIKPQQVVMATELAPRPLFHASRRPIRAPEPAAPPPAAVRPEPPLSDRYRLVGVMVGQGRQMWAYVLENGEGETMKVSVGDTLDGWRLSHIDREKVVLVKDDKQNVLEFGDGGMDNGQSVVQRDQRRRARTFRSQ